MGNESDVARLAEFERIYHAYRSRVHAYCARRRSLTDAADAVSETFLVAWRRLDDLPDEPDTLPYLYGVASRVVSNQRRSEGRRSKLTQTLRGLGVTPSIDPMTVVVRRSQDVEVANAVRRLKATDREIVMLDAWECLPREQIARLMGMSKSAVDQRIHRAYKRLARTLRQTNTDPTNTRSTAEKRGGA